MNQEKLIQIKNLKTFFNTEAGIAKAVNDVSFDIYKGALASNGHLTMSMIPDYTTYKSVLTRSRKRK